MFNRAGSKLQSGSSVTMLIIFLLLLSSVSTGLLYLEQRHHNSLLKEKVDKLQSSQVLLMVPDEQAEALAAWLQAYPEAAANLIKQAKPGQQRQVVIAPEAAEAGAIRNGQLLPHHLSSQGAVNSGSADKEQSVVSVSEDANGVKTIRLANGGILVTTRNEH